MIPLRDVISVNSRDPDGERDDRHRRAPPQSATWCANGAPKSRVMAVIKANAYGHGLVAVARALESADAFAVARVDEGLTLRAAGIKTPMVLLEGVFDREQLDAAAAAGFELVVHCAEQIELLRSRAGRRALQGVAQARQRHESSGIQGRGISAPRTRP